MICLMESVDKTVSGELPTPPRLPSPPILDPSSAAIVLFPVPDVPWSKISKLFLMLINLQAMMKSLFCNSISKVSWTALWKSYCDIRSSFCGLFEFKEQLKLFICIIWLKSTFEMASWYLESWKGPGVSSAEDSFSESSRSYLYSSISYSFSFCW